MLCSKSLMSSSSPTPVAWDITTAPIPRPTLLGAILSNNTNTSNLIFGNSNSKLYVLENDTVNYYTLSTPDNVATAVFQNSTPLTANCIKFNNSGTILYWLHNGKIFSQSLSSAWNTATKTGTISEYDIYLGTGNIFLDTLGRIAITNFDIKTDGTKIIVNVKNSNYATFVLEYSLSSAWDITTITRSYNTSSLALGSQYQYKTSWFFKSDGLKVIASDYSNLYEHSLSTAFDLSTINKTATTTKTRPNGSPYTTRLNTAGTSLYLINYASQTIESHSLSTGWDLSTYSSTISGTINPTTTLGTTATINDFDFKYDGTIFYILVTSSGAYKVLQYNLSTAWDLSTAYHIYTLPVANNYTLCISYDGKYLHNHSWASFEYYELATNYSISTAGSMKYAGTSVPYYMLQTEAMQYINANTVIFLTRYPGILAKYTVSLWGSNLLFTSEFQNGTTGMYCHSNSSARSTISPNGSFLYGMNSNYIKAVPLSISWSLSSAGTSIVTTSGNTIPNSGYDYASREFDSSGLNIYVGTNNYGIYKVPLKSGTPYTYQNNEIVATRAYQEEYLLNTSAVTDPFSLYSINFSENGSNIYWATSNSTNKLFQQTLSSSWNLASLSSTATFCTNSVSYPAGVKVSSDGSKIYGSTMYYYGNSRIGQQTLSSTYSIVSAASPIYGNLSSTYSSSLAGFCFSSNGYKVYTINSSYIAEYSLSTPYDLNTVISTPTSFISSPTSSCYNLKIDPSGTRLYTLDISNKRLYQYNMTTANQLSSASLAGSLDISSLAGYYYAFDIGNSGKTIFLGSNGGGIFAHTFVT